MSVLAKPYRSDEVRDIDAARRAGIVSIGVALGASHGDALVGAQAMLAITPEELKALLLPRPSPAGF